MGKLSAVDSFLVAPAVVEGEQPAPRWHESDRLGLPLEVPEPGFRNEP